MEKITAKVARELGEALLDAAEEVLKGGKDIHLESFGEEIVALPSGIDAYEPVMIVEAVK